MEQLTPLAYKLYFDDEELQEHNPNEADDTKSFMERQLTNRMDILKRARGKSIEEIYNQDVDIEIS